MDYSYIPNDQYYSTQSSVLTTLKAQAGWDVTKGENSPVIAVVDSGVVSHPDLPAPIQGYSAVSSLTYNNDKVGHGTSVAGVLGAIGDNYIGVSGINMSAKILAVKVDDAAGSLTMANISKGLIWAADNGAKVISMSISTSTDSVTLKNAINYAYNAGCAIFTSSGNDGKNSVNYPARYGNVMGVGATTDGISRVSWSNYGPGLDIVASGTYYTTSSSGGYRSFSGTSSSTPQVAGLASLIYALLPDATNEEVYSLIKEGAKPLGGGYNTETGYGLIDIGKTLKLAEALSIPDTPPVYPTPPVITLNSFAEMNLFVGDTYQEMGYKAVDCLGVDITASVNISGLVNTAKAGIYILTYTVTDNGGNTAKVTRTINVEEKVAAVPPAPAIVIIGSNPIVLHLGSGTSYIEQGATATDTDGKDISGSVDIIGEPDRYTEGTYTITYSVMRKDGNIAKATREVMIVAPASKVAVRTPYGFSEQAKQGTKITRGGINAVKPGWMDLKVANIDKNMTITVQLVNTASKEIAVKDSFSSAGSKQYNVGDGTYELVVTIDKANGNSKYSIGLMMPEVVIHEFDMPEVVY
jgi:hypothetical protein